MTPVSRMNAEMMRASQASCASAATDAARRRLSVAAAETIVSRYADSNEKEEWIDRERIGRGDLRNGRTSEQQGH